MYKEIAEKIKTLDRKISEVKGAERIILRADRIDWIHSCMRAEGFPLDRGAVEDILNGRMHVEVTLEEYTQIERYKQMLSYVDDTVGMDNHIDQKILIHLNGMITGRQTKPRTNVPALRQYAYLPPKPDEIMKQLRTLFRELYADGKMNTIERAAYLHNEIIRIYPFDEHCEATAQAALFYYLKQEGYYPVSLAMSDDEYIEFIKNYVNRKDRDGFTRLLERAVYNKIEMLIQLLECEEEI